MISDQHDVKQDAVDILRLVSNPQSVDNIQARTLRRNKKLTNLMNELPSVLKDVGCTCLAMKLLPYYDESESAAEDQCCQEKQSRSTLHLLTQLKPLSQALMEAGYYDHALSCAELARSIEPTLDLNLLRAYLFLTLGDNERACRIYSRAIKRLGKIPHEEIQRLEYLAKNHAAEEDLAEILAEIRAQSRQT